MAENDQNIKLRSEMGKNAVYIDRGPQRPRPWGR